MGELLAVERGIKPPPHGLDVLVRWGSRKQMPPAAIQINTPRAMAVASDKVEALRVMRHEGITTIPWGITWEDALNQRQNRRDMILGRSRSGMGGKDIVVYDPSQQYQGKYPTNPEQTGNRHDFYSVYMKPVSEVRIHIADGRPIRVQRKYCDYPDKAEANPFVRNYAHGYRFRAPRMNLREMRIDQAAKAVAAIGLDFGAVDMLMVGPYQYVLEVNTAPACSPLTAKCYASAIALMVRQRSGDEILLAPDLIAGEFNPEEDDDG